MIAAVTGGEGFIGRHLLQALTALGWQCHVVSTHDESDRPRTPESVGAAVAALKPEIVFHLGARTSSKVTLENLHATLRWNLLSTIFLFEALHGTGVRRIVYLGSCEEYGRGDTPFYEGASLDPVSPYSASKAAASCYARMFHNCFGLPVTIIRPSVVYGPGQSPNMMIPHVVSSLLRRCPVDVTEGTQTRDFLFVEDLVDALLRAANASGVEGQIFNVGSGGSVTVRSCIETIENLTGRQGMVRYGAKPFGATEIFDYAVDIRRAADSLDWRPRTKLIEGLKATVAAYAATMKPQP